MHEGITLALSGDGLLSTYHSRSDETMSHHEQIGIGAFRLRVALAHMRLKFDNCSTAPAAFLEVAFDFMKSGPASSFSKRTKRGDRLKDRPHPFPFFRGAESDDDHNQDTLDQDVDGPICDVAYWFDYSSLLAKCLRSNGSQGWKHNTKC